MGVKYGEVKGRDNKVKRNRPAEDVRQERFELQGVIAIDDGGPNAAVPGQDFGCRETGKSGTNDHNMIHDFPLLIPMPNGSAGNGVWLM